MEKNKESNSNYTVLQNVRFLHRYVFKDKVRSYFLLAIVVMVLNIIITIMPAILPAYIVHLLSQNTKIVDMILSVVLFLMLHQVLTIMTKRLEANILNFIDMERLVKGMEYYEIMMDTAYVNVESPKRTQAFYDGLDTFYDDYHIGLTHLITDARLLIQSIVGVIVYTYIFTRVSVAMAVILIGISILQIVANRRHEIWMSKNLENWKPIEAKLQYLHREASAIKNGKDIRLFHLENWFEKKMFALLSQRENWLKKQMYSEYRVKLIKRVLALVKCLIAYLFTLNSLQNGLATTDFILVISMISGLDKWVTDIFDEYNFLTINNITINRCREVLDYEKNEKKQESKRATKEVLSFHELKFENVSFRYESSDKDIISDLNMVIKKGEKIAVVGNNGAGKSTLIKLMCKLYVPTKGTIYLNGKDLATYANHEIWNMYALMFQKNTTFAFNVAENIAGKTMNKVAIESVEKNLRKSNILKRITEHPEGLHAPMTKEFRKDGIVLSGGETQKFMFARMLYSEGEIAILDEPTAALDAVAEAKFYENFHTVLKDKTCVFISHRLSSTKFCDRILLFENGEIIEEGTHDMLMREKAKYYKLYNMQASYYVEGEKNNG